MKRFFHIVGLSVAVLWLWHGGSAFAAASPRIALVIGNSGYAEAPLANPANDAQLMAETLRGLGFDVIERTNVDQKAIQLAIFELQDRLFEAGKDAVGLFFYAGHGVQVGGQNYLIPLYANIKKEREVAINAVSAGFILGQMEAADNRMNFIILDACRNNPLTRSFRSSSRGLARMDAPRGSLVAYSTGPGEVAADGTGINSPYTVALARVMQMPGVPAEKMFKLVRDSVMAETNGDQTPWEESSLTGDDFYFALAEPFAVEALPAPSSLDSGEQAFWQAIKDSDKPSDYRAYVQAYPDGIFVVLAETRAESLEAERLALAQEDATEEVVRSTANQTEIDLEFWNAIKNSGDPEMYEAYLAQFPNGTFAGLAELKRSTLRATDAERLAAEEEARRQAEAEPTAQQETHTALLAAPPEPEQVSSDTGMQDRNAFHRLREGTRVDYDNWSYTVDRVSDYESQNDAGVYGHFTDYAVFLRLPTCGYDDIDDDAKRAIETIWPLEPGKQVRLRLPSNIWAYLNVSFEVARTETIRLQGHDYFTFVVENRATSPWCKMERTLWYAPELGVIVKEQTYISGSESEHPSPYSYELSNFDQPEGSAGSQ